MPRRDWHLLLQVLMPVSTSVRSLALLGPSFAEDLTSPVLSHTWTHITELAIPIHFLVADDNTSNLSAEAMASVWPKLHTVWTWVVQSTSLHGSQLQLNLSHLGTIRRLSILFQSLDKDDIIIYLQRIKVSSAVECVSIEIEEPAPPFPVWDIVMDALFFDPRVVFICFGEFTPTFHRMAELCAGRQASAVYDLILCISGGKGKDWVDVLEKVNERRKFAKEHRWNYPPDTRMIALSDTGPFAAAI
ncbi:hypothetical protein V5O48_002163 [Marasmius crinis-equi]|uniref:Uncharacterized protein n=1 Tax=Marasmius crinis-equi TaxID=585013 RepID=A0ABR3FWF0_9AGAR